MSTAVINRRKHHPPFVVAVFGTAVVVMTTVIVVQSAVEHKTFSHVAAVPAGIRRIDQRADNDLAIHAIMHQLRDQMDADRVQFNLLVCRNDTPDGQAQCRLRCDYESVRDGRPSYCRQQEVQFSAMSDSISPLVTGVSLVTDVADMPKDLLWRQSLTERGVTRMAAAVVKSPDGTKIYGSLVVNWDKDRPATIPSNKVVVDSIESSARQIGKIFRSE